MSPDPRGNVGRTLNTLGQWEEAVTLDPAVCDFVHMPRTGTSTGTESRLLAARGWDLGTLGVTVSGHGVSSWGDGNVLESDSGNGCTALYTYEAITLCTLSG